MLVFEDNHTWRGKGVLSGRFCDCTGLPDIFNALIRETRETGTTFQRFIGTDKKLIGQERYDLAEELEDLLGGYFYLYNRLLKAGEASFHSEFAENDMTFTVEFDGYRWRAEGTLRRPGISGSFTDWFNRELLSKTSTLIKGFGTVLADGMLDPSEKEESCRELNGIIAHILCADRGLKIGELS